MLEAQSEAGNIDLFYGDETQLSQQGYVPYGWQFHDEEVFIEATRGKSINCFGLLARDNRFIWRTTQQSINAQFVLELLDAFSLEISKNTVVVLDNARIHTARKIKERMGVWQKRGLFIFYLPPYSPHLNIIERLWKQLKQAWIKPEDYQSADDLFYALNRILVNVGKELRINFNPLSG